MTQISAYPNYLAERKAVKPSAKWRMAISTAVVESLLLKLRQVPWRDLDVQNFDCDDRFQERLFSQVGLCKTALSEQARETIVAWLLPYTIRHRSTSPVPSDAPFFSHVSTCV